VGVKNKRKYNILDSIHVNCAKGETETYYNLSNFQYKINDLVIPYLNIVIYDQDFNIVDFNNIDWYINITISFSYSNELIIPPSLITNVDSGKTAREILIEEEKRNIYNFIDNLIKK
jgi:hypothetical protein